MLKFFNVMGKMLTGELSCTRTGFVFYVLDSPFKNFQILYMYINFFKFIKLKLTGKNHLTLYNQSMAFFPCTDQGLNSIFKH